MKIRRCKCRQAALERCLTFLRLTSAVQRRLTFLRLPSHTHIPSCMSCVLQLHYLCGRQALLCTGSRQCLLPPPLPPTRTQLHHLVRWPALLMVAARPSIAHSFHMLTFLSFPLCSCTIWVDGKPSCVQADGSGKAIDCSDADAKDLVATVRGNEDGVWEGMAVLTAVTRPSIALMLMPRTLSPRCSAGGDQGMERVRGVLIW